MEIKSRRCDTRAQGLDLLKSFMGPSAQAVAVIPAAGRGERSGLDIPKQYHRLAGVTTLARSIRAVAACSDIAAVVVVLDPADAHWMSEGLDQELHGLDHVLAVAIGGATRRQSVIAGCALVQEALGSSPKANPWVLVHDAARPGVTHDSLRRLCNALKDEELNSSTGAILAMPVADTIKRSGTGPIGHEIAVKETVVKETVDRSGLWAAQTPQMFRLAQLLTAYSNIPSATDEASAIEAAGGRVLLVQGNAENFKLTQPDDFLMMEALMAQSEQVSNTAATGGIGFAIGQGFDVHALVVGRPLIIGGIDIPYDKGLDGHSDADVLLHAISDAILGAAGMGDIGRHFPDTDPAFKGADSKKLLAEVTARVTAQGWMVAQIDATVIAQAPKISPYADQMQQAIGKCCAISPSQINIKGKTTEKLGFTGRGEGIAAQAVAMLVRRKE